MKRATLIGVGLTTVAVLLFVTAILVIDGSRKDVVAEGVRIGTLEVGGLDREQARALVQRELAGNVAEPVVATHGERRFVLEPGDARARLDAAASVDAALSRSRAGNPFSRVLTGGDASGTVAPRVSFSRAAVDDFARRVAERVGRKARDADIDWRDGKLERTRARNGLEVQRPELVTALVSIVSNPTEERTVDVPVKRTERPERNLKDLAERYPTVIAVDRDAKVLRLYKNLRLEARYKIAVGKAGLDTVGGRYEIKEKTVDPPWNVPTSDWAGDLAGQTIAPGDPRNPLEARWMGFHDGQGIHGTDDIASLGTAASHGCIRMSVPAVKELFGKVEVGTPLFLQ